MEPNDSIHVSSNVLLVRGSSSAGNCGLVRRSAVGCPGRAKGYVHRLELRECTEVLSMFLSSQRLSGSGTGGPLHVQEEKVRSNLNHDGRQ